MTESPVPAPLPLFSPFQIAVASFIGGPIPACWLFARNYRTLGRPRSAQHTLAWGFAGMVALVVASFYLPENFPRAAIPIGYTIGLYQTAHQIHGATVREHLAQGGNPGPWPTVFKVSIATVLVILAILIGSNMLLKPA